jgi:hypothetical protein
MNRKQLAEMIKEIRRQKLDELIGKPGSFDPAHRKGTHGEDPQSPNQFYHVKEQVLNELQARARRTHGLIASKLPNRRAGIHGRDSLPLSGGDVLDRYRLSSSVVEEESKEKNKMILSKRKPSGQQRMRGRYDEETMPVGKTDTGKSSDVIDVSPKDKNSVKKEINITKENKEK